MINLTETHFEILNALDKGWLKGRISELDGWDMAAFYQMHDNGLVSGVRMDTEHKLICVRPQITAVGQKALAKRNQPMLDKTQFSLGWLLALSGLVGLMYVVFLMY